MQAAWRWKQFVDGAQTVTTQPSKILLSLSPLVSILD
jgi:hypothetical protein